MKPGDRVRLTVGSRELDATVMIVSENGRSVLLFFEGFVQISAPGGGMMMACGALPIMCGEAGSPDADTWVEALCSSQVAVRPAPQGEA